MGPRSTLLPGLYLFVAISSFSLANGGSIEARCEAIDFSPSNLRPQECPQRTRHMQPNSMQRATARRIGSLYGYRRRGHPPAHKRGDRERRGGRCRAGTPTWSRRSTRRFGHGASRWSPPSRPCSQLVQPESCLCGVGGVRSERPCPSGCTLELVFECDFDLDRRMFTCSIYNDKKQCHAQYAMRHATYYHRPTTMTRSAMRAEARART